MQKNSHYFSIADRLLWGISALLIVLIFILFDRSNYIAMIASLIGVSALLLNAKGNPIGQALIIVFSLIYGWISFSCAYYGEMITYLGMSAPMALFALITWLKNPYKGNRAQVRVSRLTPKELPLLLILTTGVTVTFYFILRALQTANLPFSTLSVTTSFIAVYLTLRRSPFFALAYAANDIVLIVLWFMASIKNPSYFSVIICFIVFLVNDLYGFFCWLRMQKKQAADKD